ncbi:MAG: PAS domain S-box protein, partial [Thermodesulfovibrionales bacterium]|nr:PAS domain S-box protein [Thermodesulfovibrionales bacterium]
MKRDAFLKALLNMQTWKLMVAIVLLSEVFTAIMSSIISYLWWNRLDLDLLLIGSIDALVVSFIVGGMLVFLFRIVGKKDEALRECDERYKVLFNNLNDAVLVHGIMEDGRPGNFIEANDAATRIHGYSKEELLKMSPAEMIDPEKGAEVKPIVKKLMKDKHVIFETVDMTKDGRSMPVEISSHMFDFRGKPMIMSIVRDISERKLVEEELKEHRDNLDKLVVERTGALAESEEKFRSYIDNSPIGIFIADADAKYVEVNEAACEMTGYTEDKLLNLGIADLVPDDFLQEAGGSFQRLFREGKASIESRFRRRDGSVGWWIVDAVKLSDDRYIGFATEITGLKGVEQELEESRETLRNLSSHLENMREEERKRISREVHDELGQDLTGLNMQLSWLGGKLGEGNEHLVNKIESMSDIIHRMIKAVQRIASELRPNLLDTLGIIAACENEIGRYKEMGGIEIDAMYDLDAEGVGPEVSITLYRILQETLTNIVRHADASRVEIVLKEEDGLIVLAVKDDGRGITDEQISDQGSFGILSIHERVHAFGGSVYVSGRSGEGTNVIVKLPAGVKVDYQD